MTGVEGFALEVLTGGGDEDSRRFGFSLALEALTGDKDSIRFDLAAEVLAGEDSIRFHNI